MRWNKGAGLVLSMLMVTILRFSSVSAAEATDYVPDQMVCQVVTAQISIDSINALYGTSTGPYLSLIGSYLLYAPSGTDVVALAAEIDARPDVIYCQPNYLLDAPEAVQSSQPFLDEQQVGTFEEQAATATVQLSSAQTISTGTAVKVGVIDVGVDLAHPALSGTAVSGFDYVDNDPNATDPLTGVAAGHGTFVAGIVHLVAPDAVTQSYRVLDTAGRGNGFTVAEAVMQAVADTCKVINLSMVMSGKHETLNLAIEYARNHNVLVVAAAGNDSTSDERFPANDSYTIAVAGVDSANLKADFSNYNGKVDVCAPATMIYAPHHDTLFAWWNGTSFAAPFVAGEAALLYAANPQATWNDIVNAITTGVVNIDGINPAYAGDLGSGVIDMSAALQMILGGVTCGDLNGDNLGPDVSDLSYLVDYLFRGGAGPVYPPAGQIDGEGTTPNIADLTYLVSFLFASGPPPACGF